MRWIQNQLFILLLCSPALLLCYGSPCPQQLNFRMSITRFVKQFINVYALSFKISIPHLQLVKKHLSYSLHSYTPDGKAQNKTIGLHLSFITFVIEECIVLGVHHYITLLHIYFTQLIENTQYLISLIKSKYTETMYVTDI